MDRDLFKYNRKSFIEIGEVFFRKATINQLQELLLGDELKEKNFYKGFEDVF